MKTTHRQVYDTGCRVQALFDASDAFFRRVNDAGLCFELDDVSTTLGAAAGDQAGGRVTARGEAAKQRTRRVAPRRNPMRPIASVTTPLFLGSS